MLSIYCDRNSAIKLDTSVTFEPLVQEYNETKKSNFVIYELKQIIMLLNIPFILNRVRHLLLLIPFFIVMFYRK